MILLACMLELTWILVEMCPSTRAGPQRFWHDPHKSNPPLSDKRLRVRWRKNWRNLNTFAHCRINEGWNSLSWLRKVPSLSLSLTDRWLVFQGIFDHVVILLFFFQPHFLISFIGTVHYDSGFFFFFFTKTTLTSCGCSINVIKHIIGAVT